VASRCRSAQARICFKEDEPIGAGQRHEYRSDKVTVLVRRVAGAKDHRVAELASVADTALGASSGLTALD